MRERRDRNWSRVGVTIWAGKEVGQEWEGQEQEQGRKGRGNRVVVGGGEMRNRE